MGSLILISGISAVLYSLFSIADHFSLQGITALRKKDAKNLIARNVIQHVIDVRTKSEWNTSHYKNATHIPLDSFTINNAQIRRIDKNDAILVYCNFGKRALKGAKLLHDNGFKNVYYVVGDSMKN